jgi:hypothetical protein
MDMKNFVDTDADIRLARRIRRDTVERGRDISSVLDQYGRFVKPAFDDFVLPSKYGCEGYTLLWRRSSTSTCSRIARFDDIFHFGLWMYHFHVYV